MSVFIFVRKMLMHVGALVIMLKWSIKPKESAEKTRMTTTTTRKQRRKIENEEEEKCCAKES
jgi:uncharacterized protein (DUF2384 family)